MSKLILLFALSLSCFSFSQQACTYCTRIEDALVDPENVTHLDLSAQGLKVLPERLEELINLRSLNVSENLINEINFTSYAWVWLEELNLSNNPGINTLELGGIATAMPRLKTLSLRNCSAMMLSPEVSKLKALEHLDLGENSFLFLPNELGEIKKLKTLELDGNQLKNADFLTNMWQLENLDVSGNEELDLRGLATALYFKPALKHLAVTPSNRIKTGLPKTFGTIAVTHLTLKDASMDQLQSRLSSNKELKQLTLDNIHVEDPKRFSSSMNRLTQVETLVFKNMTVPKMVDQITTVDKMVFEYSDFEDLAEVKKIKPTIDIVSIGTNIADGDYIGNSKVAKMGTKNTIEQTAEPVRVNEAMLSNQVPKIVVPEAQTIKVLGDTPCIVNTEFSEFAIPEKAFLSANGEVYTGEVEIQVKEYMDPVLNALSGAPMVFQSPQGSEVFASSGMMDFRAYDDQGNELQPNPESIIEVQMDDLQPAETSNFYTYNESENNWDVAPEPRPSDFMEQKKKILDSINELSAEDVTGFKVVPVGIFMKYKKSRKDPYKLTFSSRGTKKRLKRIKGEAGTIYTANPEQRWIAKRKVWKIDTTVSEEMLGLLSDIKEDQRVVRKYYGERRTLLDLFKKKAGFDYAPRIIKDLTIQPNFDQDNYSLTFSYRDSNYRIPVILSLSGSVSRIQSREKRHFHKFQKEQRYGDKERKVIDKYREEELDKYAKMRRFLLKNSSSLMSYNSAQASKEYIRFGLTSFGMVNCDYFFRNVPDGYLAFDSTGVDMEGRAVVVPRDVRSIFLDDNAYVSTSSLDIPIYKKRRSILLFLISAAEIGIVKGWDVLSNGFARPKVERVSIKGLSPDQVSKKIMEVGKK